jgi:Spy/CpxP family protein refolding chaperone
MIMKTYVIVSLAIALTILAGTAIAQQPQANNSAASTQPNPQMRRMMRRRGMGAPMFALRQLNLTDQQLQQIRTIMGSQFQSTQAQRQELRQLMHKRWSGALTDADTARAQELRQQLMQSRQGVHTQIMAVLTPEQKTQLENMAKTRRENREKFGPKKQRII